MGQNLHVPNTLHPNFLHPSKNMFKNRPTIPINLHLSSQNILLSNQQHSVHHGFQYFQAQQLLQLQKCIKQENALEVKRQSPPLLPVMIKKQIIKAEPEDDFLETNPTILQKVHVLPDLSPLYQKNITKVASKIKNPKIQNNMMINQKIQNDICSELYHELFEKDNIKDIANAIEPQIQKELHCKLYKELIKNNSNNMAKKNRLEILKETSIQASEKGLELEKEKEKNENSYLPLPKIVISTKQFANFNQVNLMQHKQIVFFFYNLN